MLYYMAEELEPLAKWILEISHVFNVTTLSIFIVSCGCSVAVV